MTTLEEDWLMSIEKFLDDSTDVLRDSSSSAIGKVIFSFFLRCKVDRKFAKIKLQKCKNWKSYIFTFFIIFPISLIPLA